MKVEVETKSFARIPAGADATLKVNGKVAAEGKVMMVGVLEPEAHPSSGN